MSWHGVTRKLLDMPSVKAAWAGLHSVPSLLTSEERKLPVYVTRREIRREATHHTWTARHTGSECPKERRHQRCHHCYVSRFLRQMSWRDCIRGSPSSPWYPASISQILPRFRVEYQMQLPQCTDKQTRPTSSYKKN